MYTDFPNESVTLESLYHSIFENHPSPICIITLKSEQIHSCNSSFAKFLGYPKEMLIGRSLTHLQKESLAEIISLFSEAKKPNDSNNIFTTKINCIHSDKRIIPRQVSVEFHLGSSSPYLIFFFRESLSQVIPIDEQNSEHQNAILETVDELINEIGEYGMIVDSNEKDFKTKLYEKLRKSHFEIYQRQFAIDQHAIVAITNKKGTIIYANSKFCAISKYSKKELIGKNHRIINSGHHSRYFFQNMYETISQGDTWHGEIKNRAKDGSYYWVATTIAPLKNTSGEIEQYLAIRTDITERVKAENSLRVSEANLKAVFENSLDSIIFINLDKEIQFFNEIASERAVGVLGKKLEIGMPMHSMFSKEEIAEFDTHFKNALAGERILFDRPFPSENPLYWFELQYAPVLNKELENIGVLFTARDITFRKQAEEKVYASEMFARAIIDSVTAHICVLDKEGTIKTVNKAWLEFVGEHDPYNDKSIVGKNYLAICDSASGQWSEEAKFMSDGIRRVIKEEIDDFIMEYPCHTDKGKFWFTAKVTRFHDNSGNIVIAHELITERKQAEVEIQRYTEELETVNQMKNKFFSIIAHDLRNPFAGIIGIAEIIESKLSEQNNADLLPYLKYIQMIATSSRQASALLENLLQWARSQTNEIAFDPIKLAIKNIVASNIALVQGNAFTKNISIEANLKQDSHVMADEKLLNTILRNLLTNAIKFTHPNGKITVSEEENGSFLNIKISDTGTGISEENLKKLFRIDSKFTKVGTENEKGSGLGLILCKEFIEIQGGEIWVESEIAKGSTFTLSLPLA